jgi:hypothetical protein
MAWRAPRFHLTRLLGAVLLAVVKAPISSPPQTRVLVSSIVRPRVLASCCSRVSTHLGCRATLRRQPASGQHGVTCTPVEVDEKGPSGQSESRARRSLLLPRVAGHATGDKGSRGTRRAEPQVVMRTGAMQPERRQSQLRSPKRPQARDTVGSRRLGPPVHDPVGSQVSGPGLPSATVARGQIFNCCLDTFPLPLGGSMPRQTRACSTDTDVYSGLGPAHDGRARRGPVSSPCSQQAAIRVRVLKRPQQGA